MKPPKTLGRPELPGLPREYPSIKAMATALTIPTAVLRQAKAAGCPAFSSQGRINVAQWIRWMVTDGAENESVDWGKRLTQARAEREELRLSIERQETAPRAILADLFVGHFSRFLVAVEKTMKEDLPPILGNLPAQDVSKILGRTHDEIVEVFRASLSQVDATRIGAPDTEQEREATPDGEKAPRAKTPLKHGSRKGIVRKGSKRG